MRLTVPLMVKWASPRSLRLVKVKVLKSKSVVAKVIRRGLKNAKVIVIMRMMGLQNTNIAQFWWEAIGERENEEEVNSQFTG